MKKSKLLDYLSSFEAAELKKFEQFVASPYFNSKKELIPLVRYLAKCYPKFSAAAVSKEVIVEQVPIKAKNGLKELTYQMSFLFKLVEKFLQISKFENESKHKEVLLAEALYEKNLLKYFQHDISKSIDLHEKTKEKETSFYLKGALLYDLHSRSNVKRSFDDSLQKASDYNDYYFFLNKLKYSSSMLDRSSFLKADYDTAFLDETVNFLVEHNIGKEPLISIYLNILAIVRGREAKDKFKLLKRQIFENSENIAKDEFKDIYIYAINFCARQIKKNDLAYLQEAFDLYRAGIGKKILLNENEELTYWTYTNVVKLGLRLKDFKLTKDFIHENKDKIPKKFREDAFNYSLSELNYYTKNFEEAHRLINFIKVDDSFLHAMSRITLCKIYFESYEVEPLLSLIASFSIFLKRDKKLSSNMKTIYKNYCDLLFQLLKRNQKKLPAVIEKIKTTEYISDREWLLQAAEKIQTDKKWKLTY